MWISKILKRNNSLLPWLVFICVVLSVLLFSCFGLLVWNKGDNNGRSKRSVDDDDNLFTSSGFGGGAMYTRWGRHVCPDTNTEVVYKGWAAGSWFDNHGGGANYVCLTENPVWGTYNEVADNYANIYGAEFEIKSQGEHKNFPFSQQNCPNLANHNVPCIVCRSIERVSQVMVPGTTVCMEGWTREYDGYLATGHYAHKGRQEFVCVDADPEANASGYRDENGAKFHSVEVQCGSLPCPPYIQHREVTCVVCTR